MVPSLLPLRLGGRLAQLSVSVLLQWFNEEGVMVACRYASAADKYVCRHTWIRRSGDRKSVV